MTALIHAPPPVLPALIADAGHHASLRFLEYFSVHIRTPNTRAAYMRAASAFLAWCHARGLSELARVQPMHVAAYIEELGRVRAAPTVEQHLACIRMLFDWLVTGQIVPSNPAHAVRGPRHSAAREARRCLPPRRRATCSEVWTCPPSSACAIAPSSP